MRISAKLISAFSLCALVACNQSSTSTSDTSSSSTGTISSLPKATGPVDGSSASAFEAINGLSMSDVTTSAATTGVALKSWNNSSLWGATKSRAMCETGSLLQDAFDGAMSPDKIACYVGAVQAANKFSGQTIDDGNYVYFKLVNLPSAGGYQPRIKMKIVKSGGAITTFEMFSCFDNSTGTTQTEYLSSTISNGSVSLTSKNIGGSGTQSYGSSTSVSGTVDSSYKWNSKTITVDRFFTDTGNSGSFSQNATVTQLTSSFRLSGYNKGSWGSGASKQVWTNKFYIAVQGLNMSTPKSVSLGDGSASYAMDFCQNPQGGGGTSCTGAEATKFSATAVDSWLGDTRAKLTPATGGDYYSIANSGSVPSSTPTVSVSFTGAQTWDCTNSSFISVDMSDFNNTSTTLGAAIATCDAKYSFNKDGGSSGYYCDAAQ